MRTMYLRQKKIKANYLNETSKPPPRQGKIMKPLPDNSSTIVFC